MKKTLLTLSIAVLATPIFSLTPQHVSADDTIQTVAFTDGVANINYPSKYAGRTVAFSDGNYAYGKTTLNSSGDATIDLKTGVNFRTVAPNSVFLDFEGFANPISRSTNLAKEISGYRLMFKQNFNATEYFQLKVPTLSYHESYAEATLTQADNIKRYAYSGATVVKSDSTGYNLDFEFPQTTQATFSGIARPTTAVVYKNTLVGGGTSNPQDAQFVFESKNYPGVVLR